MNLRSIGQRYFGRCAKVAVTRNKQRRLYHAALTDWFFVAATVRLRCHHSGVVEDSVFWGVTLYLWLRVSRRFVQTQCLHQGLGNTHNGLFNPWTRNLYPSPKRRNPPNDMASHPRRLNPRGTMCLLWGRNRFSTKQVSAVLCLGGGSFVTPLTHGLLAASSKPFPLFVTH
jgi:hypothetical protein